VRLSPDVLLQAGLPPDLLKGSRVEAFTPVGCAHCHKGFSGRTGIFQVMPVSTDMQTLILREVGNLELTQQARLEGVSTLRLAGLRKVLNGITSLDEVLANTRHGS
jgi:type IV pilus assembly protein PilB